MILKMGTEFQCSSSVISKGLLSQVAEFLLHTISLQKTAIKVELHFKNIHQRTFHRQTKIFSTLLIP